MVMSLQYDKYLETAHLEEGGIKLGLQLQIFTMLITS